MINKTGYKSEIRHYLKKAYVLIYYVGTIFYNRVNISPLQN